jgi:hypothetical protein
MVVLALAMFLALFSFPREILGVYDVTGMLQLGLFTAFLFGMVCGYRVRT